MTSTTPPATERTAAYSGQHNLQMMSRMSRYNEWIFDTLKADLGSQVLEAGCGNGNITRLILKSPALTRYVGVDLSPAYCETLRETLGPRAGVPCRFESMDLTDPSFQRLASPLFDTIVCLNVLEHIEHDLRLLQTFRAMLQPSGRLLLQVPAFPQLYGTIDEIDGHFRRYTRGVLQNLIREAGFTIRRSFYFNAAGIPAWLWHGKILKLKTHSAQEVRLWDYAVPVLRRLEQVIPVPVGLSVILIAEKPHA